MLKAENCRTRQRRLLEVMQRLRLDAVLLGSTRNVYYFTAHLTDWKHQGGCIIFSDGTTWLCTADEPPESVAADQTVKYEAKSLSTLHPDQPQRVARMATDRLGGMKRIAVDASAVISQLDAASIHVESIEPHLWHMRRVKDPDELNLMKRAIACSGAMYQRAREIIEPGVSEVHVFAELQAAAVESAQEPLSAPLGNDYTCGGGGGAPRAGKVAKAGQLYILDLGPAYRGYFADNARTFTVDRKANDRQMKIWQAVMESHRIFQRSARLGSRCRELFHAVNQHLKSSVGKELEHHLGHGVGLEPHEFPHLNPHWDDVLQEGETVSVEPGVYGEDLGGGMRIENTYLVTGDGVKNLTDFPTELG